MPTLAELRLYPIKSCAGISLASAKLSQYGLHSEGIYDRSWMLVDHTGNMLSERTVPQMARIKPSIRDGEVFVRAAGLSLPELHLPRQLTGAAIEVLVWEESLGALKQDQEINAWFSAALGETCYLVRMSPSTTRLTHPAWSGEQAAAFYFADGFPYLISNLQSLAELNSRLQQAERAALSMDRFRANLVLDALPAYEEDYLAQIHFANGASLRLVKPCSRCNMPSIDQETGHIGPDPLDIMQSYRSKAIVDGGICFGMNALLAAGEGLTLSVGMQVEAELAF